MDTSNYKSIIGEAVNKLDPVLIQKIKRYSGKPGIREQRTNILFLKDGSLTWNFEKFDDIEDAILDAVKNWGEDLDEMIKLCYSQTNSRLKPWFIEQLEFYPSN